MTTPDNHGFALYSVELEYRGNEVLTRTRPMNADLPRDEPIMNPRGVLLERASNLLEVGVTEMLVLTSGQSHNGEPLLDYFGYLGPDNVPVFVEVRPTSLYDMAETLLRVVLIHVVVDGEGYRENTEGHEVLFIAARDGTLRPLEKTGEALWPQKLLDAVQGSLTADGSYRRATSSDVRLDTPYYHQREFRDMDAPEIIHECFVVCRATERGVWLRRLKDRLREGLSAARATLVQMTDHLDNALNQLR